MSRRSYVRATGSFVRRANLKAQKMIHTLHTRETYRDESNGTTKSKNKLHLTIFHKRMTSWFRKNCVSRASLTKTSQKRRRGEVTSRSEAAACWFSPIGLENMQSSRLRQVVARPGTAASVCDRCKEGKQSGFMMLFYSSHSSPLVACFWHTHSPALFAHETFPSNFHQYCRARADKKRWERNLK